MKNEAFQPISREGRFLFSVMDEPEIAEYDSGAAAIRLQLQAVREWCVSTGAWKDVAELAKTRAEFFVTKKSGEPIPSTLEMLFESIRMNLDDQSICGADFIGRLCQGEIRVDTYGGTTRYKVTRLYPENTLYRPAKLRRLGNIR